MAIYSDERIEFVQKSRRDKPFKMAVSHFHGKHELYYLAEGQTKYFIGNEIFLLSAGDMIFVPKGQFHKTDSEENVGIERVLFVFDDDFAGDDYKAYIEEMTQNKHITFGNEHLYKINDIVHKTVKESEKREKGYADMQRLYLRQMLILISRYRTKKSPVRFNEAYTIIQEIAKYISANCDGDLSLGTLAKRYSISPNYLSKQFKSVTGVGLSEYINISRISAAEKLLTTTDMPITRVATECGFNDSNYFAAVFKRIKGVTPKKYSMMNK